MKIDGVIIASPFKSYPGCEDRVGNRVVLEISDMNIDLTQSIKEVVETQDGKLWATCLGAGGEMYATQINFCPLTGKPAKVKRGDFDHSKAWLSIAETAYEQKRYDIEKAANDAYNNEQDSYAKSRCGPPGKLGRPNSKYEKSIIAHNADLIERVTTINGKTSDVEYVV